MPVPSQEHKGVLKNVFIDNSPPPPPHDSFWQNQKMFRESHLYAYLYNANRALYNNNDVVTFFPRP